MAMRASVRPYVCPVEMRDGGTERMDARTASASFKTLCYEKVYPFMGGTCARRSFVGANKHVGADAAALCHRSAHSRYHSAHR